MGQALTGRHDGHASGPKNGAARPAPCPPLPPPRGNQVDFAGGCWAIALTHRKTAGIIHHPDRQFWGATEPTAPPQNK
jgi:hypothetical protein